MSAKEKAKECPLQDSVDGLRWAEAMASRFALDSGELLPWTCMMIETAKQFGYRTALEWVLLYATEISEKYKSQSFGLPLIPANTLKSKIEKELEK